MFSVFSCGLMSMMCANLIMRSLVIDVLRRFATAGVSSQPSMQFLLSSTLRERVGDWVGVSRNALSGVYWDALPCGRPSLCRASGAGEGGKLHVHVFPVTQHMAAMAPPDFISEDLSVGSARGFDVGWSSALCACSLYAMQLSLCAYLSLYLTC